MCIVGLDARAPLYLLSVGPVTGESPGGDVPAPPISGRRKPGRLYQVVIFCVWSYGTGPG